MKLFNSTKLAAELGVSTWVMKGAKLASKHYGDSPFTGLLCTVEDFHAWLKRHPDFVANHWVRCDRRVTATPV